MNFSAVIISLKTAGVSIIITFFLGLFLAKTVYNIRDNKLKIFLDALLTLPLVLPPTVMGFFLLYIFGVNRAAGKLFLDVFGIKIAFSWFATVLASVAVASPLMYRSSRGAFEQVDLNLIHAGRTLGMSEKKIFWKIILPVAFPGIMSGTILAFARGLGEFGATSMIAGNIEGKTRTLPLAIYSAVSARNDKDTFSYVFVLVIISFIMVAIINFINVKEQKYNQR